MAVPGIGDRLEGVHAVAAAIAAGRVTELKLRNAAPIRLSWPISWKPPPEQVFTLSTSMT